MQVIELKHGGQVAEKVFEGFEEPLGNWTKLPNAFIDALPLVKTLAEAKVVLYVLRHTWGFQDTTERRISEDEFMHGRKRKGGGRMDNGTGMSRNAVKKGIALAVTHHFLTVETDDTDRARKKRVYALAMKPQENQTVRNELSDGRELTIEGSGVDHRTKKDTKERKYRKKRANRSVRVNSAREENRGNPGDESDKRGARMAFDGGDPTPGDGSPPLGPPAEGGDGDKAFENFVKELADMCEVFPDSGNVRGAARELVKEIGTAEDALAALEWFRKDKWNREFARRAGPYAIRHGVVHQHERNRYGMVIR